MPTRSVNVSVRMSADEASLLAEAHVPGATTPSEKLRALVHDLARQERARSDFAAAAAEVEALLAPARRRLREAMGGGRASDVFPVLFERLPEIVARLAMAKARLDQGETAEAVEADAVSDAAALFAELIHVAQAEAPRALDPGALRRALEPLGRMAPKATNGDGNG